MRRERKLRAACCVAIGALGLSGCSRSGDDAAPSLPAAVELPSPAGSGSGEPFLSPAAGGGVLLSWLEPADSGHALRFARLTGEHWSEPVTIATGDRFFVNWADFPSVVELANGRLLAHWLVRNGTGRAAYDVWYAISADGGANWSTPIRPHNDGTETEHGFVSIFEAAGAPGLAWLDGRDYAGNHEGAEMSLRSAAVGADGAPGPERLVDGRVCDCCQTDVAIASSGPVLAFRDRSPGEVRDIAVARLIDGEWAEPRLVHADDWVIPACPVNGPAIAAREANVAVAWFTAARDTARVNVAFSANAAVSFARPIRVDLGDPVGRVDLALLDDGTAVVSWLERDAAGTHVLARAVRPDGSLGEPLNVGASSDARPSGFPRMAAAGDRLILAWTWPGPPSAVRVAAIQPVLD